MNEIVKAEDRMRRAFLAFCCLMVVGGCSFPAPERYAEPHSYILSAGSFTATASSASNSSSPDHKPVLLVSRPMAEAGFDSPRMIYLSRPHEISYYADNQWVDTPARMLAPILAQAMEKSGLWKSVVQTPGSARADYRLDTEDLSLEQQFFSHPSRVRLKLRLQLVELNEQSIVASREFEIWEEAPSDDAYGGVVAANRAVGEALEQGINWLSAIMKQPTQAGQVKR